MYHYAANNPVKYTDPDGREVVGQAKRSLLHRLAVNSKTTEWAQKGTFPNETVGFSFDGKYYHATFDCWQGSLLNGYLGYNNLYDKVFDSCTSMAKARFDFSSGGQDLTLWAWKGDYLNMGAGAEIGIYRRPAEGINNDTLVTLSKKGDHFIVDKTLAMDMSLLLTHNGKVVGSYEGNHWWATSFNPFKLNVKAEDLKATYTVNFGAKTQMYYDFKAKWQDDLRWSFNDVNSTAILNF